MALAFDHQEILRDALHKIREKMLTTVIAKEFLPEEFTISELYQVIQTVVPDFWSEISFAKSPPRRAAKG